MARPFRVALVPHDAWHVGCINCDESVYRSILVSSPNVVFQVADAILVAAPSLLRHYRPLYDWLKERPGRVQGIHIAFGPGDTFFTCDALGKRIKSSQTIPQNLRDVLALNPRKTSAKVAFGIKDSYFLLWSDGEYTWNLRQQYQRLEQILREAERDGKPVKVRRTQYFDFACVDLTMGISFSHQTHTLVTNSSSNSVITVSNIVCHLPVLCKSPKHSRTCWMVKNMKYHFYGNTTDLYTNVLERTPLLYDRGQLSIRILQRQ
jgi:hypothetical protein